MKWTHIQNIVMMSVLIVVLCWNCSSGRRDVFDERKDMVEVDLSSSLQRRADLYSQWNRGWDCFDDSLSGDTYTVNTNSITVQSALDKFNHWLGDVRQRVRLGLNPVFKYWETKGMRLTRELDAGFAVEFGLMYGLDVLISLQESDSVKKRMVRTMEVLSTLFCWSDSSIGRDSIRRMEGVGISAFESAVDAQFGLIARRLTALNTSAKTDSALLSRLDIMMLVRELEEIRFSQQMGALIEVSCMAELMDAMGDSVGLQVKYTFAVSGGQEAYIGSQHYRDITELFFTDYYSVEWPMLQNGSFRKSFNLDTLGNVSWTVFSYEGDTVLLDRAMAALSMEESDNYWLKNSLFEILWLRARGDGS